MEKLVYKQIKADLEAKIKDQVYKDNRLPSERELAESYKVNRLTLRAALKDLETDGLVYKVQGKGTFVSDGSGAVPEGVELKAAFVCDSSVSTGDELSRYLKGIQNALPKAGMSVEPFLIKNLSKKGLSESKLIEKVKEGKLHGIFILGALSAKDVSELLQAGAKVVSIGPQYEELPISSVLFNVYRAGMMAVEYLAEKGCRHIGTIIGPKPKAPSKSGVVGENLSGYIKALSNANLEFDPGLVMSGEWVRDSSKDASVLIKKKVDGIICLNEYYTKQVVNYLAERGIGKEQVRVVGSCPADVVYPFANIGFPLVQMGEEAVRLMEKSLRNGGFSPQKMIVEPKVVEL